MVYFVRNILNVKTYVEEEEIVLGESELFNQYIKNAHGFIEYFIYTISFVLFLTFQSFECGYGGAPLYVERFDRKTHFCNPSITALVYFAELLITVW